MLNKEHKKTKKSERQVYLRAPRPTASRLSSVDLADFLARKDLTDFLHEVLLDFLAYNFAHSVNNILSYLILTNLPLF
jgi:hypothetical protein